jgi:hypothetical protein
LASFALREEDGTIHNLVSAPAEVGVAPLWRGDTVRQPFAIVAPGDLPAGDYELGIHSSAPKSFVSLCTVVVVDVAEETLP